MPDRPEIPSDVKRRVRAECGDRCAVCGYGAGLETAHLVGWSESRDNSPENLILLCANCHARADREKWSEKRLREYRDKPWVARQLVGQIPATGRTVKVTVTIEADANDDDALDLAQFVRSAIAGFQNRQRDATG